MDTIYVVTYGEYSGYNISGAFSTRELADEFCRRKNLPYPGEEYRVEEFEIDAGEDIDLIRLGLDFHKVVIEGTEYGREGTTFATHFVRTPDNPHLFDGNIEQSGRFTAWVQTEDRERAIKVAQERLMQHKARLAGIG